MDPAVGDARQDWWFAVSAIPLIVAIMGPLVNLMTITGLVMSWKSPTQDTTADVQEVGLSDPDWCIALRGISLACGVTGTISLLCRLGGAVQHGTYLIIALFAWILAATTLIGALAAVHIHDPPTQDQEVYSQSYWAALIAAVLYVLLSILVGVNMLGCRLGQYSKDGKLTARRRNLALQNLSFVIWLAVGGVVFSQSIGLSYADALYFSTVTLLTIGFGDITNPNPLGRGLIFPYTVVGIVLVGLIVAGFSQNAKEILCNEILRRHTDRQREAVVGRFKLSSESKPGCSLGVDPEDERRFDAMRSLQTEAASFRRTTSLIIIILLFIVTWVIGAIAFWTLEEDLTYFDSLYFGFCCLLTIGYGDITPTSNAGRQFFIVWSLVSVPVMTTLVTKVGETALRIYPKVTEVASRWTSAIHTYGMTAGSKAFSAIENALEMSKSRLERAGNDGAPCSERQILFERHRDAPEQSEFAFGRQLALAIQKVSQDSRASQPMHYSYREWVEFRALICSTSLDTAHCLEGRWDWIGEHSPLLSGKTEPQWVLDQLCESLLLYMASRH
ncbi:hypothetical protein BJY04DRAFT_217618 [Aspergillus karnatakaensis]|uniref:potassium channel family protein n=1 Tax=Aspergillus karnatakaensis TaxID=1810916 RepID=UPI003CCE3E25